MLKSFLQKTIKEKRKGKFIVGVCSTHVGAGATYFSMLLLTYLSEWLGLKTTYINFESKEEFSKLKNHFLKDKEMNEDYFLIGRTTFYSNENLNRLSEIIGGHTDCIILDMGHQFLENKNEFLRSDIKIVISSLVIWKRDKLHYFLEHVNHNSVKADWKYVIPFANEKAVKEASSTYKISIYQEPFEPDPFTINSTVIRFFERLLHQ
jgi:hypothetical protein